jgi:1,4-alpha-glucan branching enzyme
MNRYHFKTDGQSDVEGVRLADLAAVKCEAGKVAGSIMCAAADEVWQRREWTVTVTDDFGVKVLEFSIVGTERPATA